MLDVCTGNGRTHKFALRMKVHRSDFLSFYHVCTRADVSQCMPSGDAKVMCDGRYVYDAHNAVAIRVESSRFVG